MTELEENIKNKTEQVSARSISTQKKRRGTIIICTAAFVIFIGMIAVFITMRENFAANLAKQKEEAEIKAVLDVETIYSNVYINDINIGGLTKEQAKETLISQVSTILSGRTINFKYLAAGYTKEFTFEELGVSYDFDQAIEEAYNFGRENADIKQRYAEVMENKDRGKYLTAEWVYDSTGVEECVDIICSDLDIEAVNSEYKYENGEVVITKASSGRKVDREQTVEMANELLPLKRDAEVNIPVDTVMPEYTEEDFQFTSSVIGTYQSTYGTGNDDRITNLSVAANKLNGSVIMPGETFSTNEAFSPYTEESGYKYAGAYVNGELVEDIGGGVCQVSSALYNAALMAELEITERYNHSKKVGYMDYAYDATLAGDVKDLKITNNTNYPIIIKASLENNAVNVTIEGYEVHDSGRTLEFYNEKTSETDSTVTYELYKKVYENGELVDTVKINKSTYNTK
ncbi:MAG: VanW family protein [Clostridiales bacterium]|nr:VanW family protein [Clostridiales bacterium]